MRVELVQVVVMYNFHLTQLSYRIPTIWVSLQTLFDELPEVI